MVPRSAIFALAAVAGCDRGVSTYDIDTRLVDIAPGALAYAMGSDAETHGLQIPDGRDWSAAGMSGLTCQFNILEGSTGTDLDVDESDDQLVDGIGDMVLVQNGDDYQIVAFPGGDFGDGWTVPTGGVSRLVDGGHVDLAYRRDDCLIAFHDGTEAAWIVPDAYCNDGGGMVIGSDNTVWLGADETIARVTPDGYVELPIGGQLLAADRASGGVLAGAPGASEIAGLRPDGSLAWRTDVGGPVAGFNVHGHLAVASIAGSTDAASEIVMINPNTGAETSRQIAGELAAGAVAISDRFVAIESPNRFDYLRIR